MDERLCIVQQPIGTNLHNISKMKEGILGNMTNVQYKINTESIKTTGFISVFNSLQAGY